MKFLKPRKIFLINRINELENKMNKFSKIIIVLLFVTVFAENAYLQNLTNDTINRSQIVAELRKHKNDAFTVGEHLEFDVRYGFIVAGKAVLEIPKYEVYQGRKSFYIESRVNSLPFFSTFYKVEDKYVSVIDAEGIFPWRFEQHIREGGYKRDFEAEFDHTLNIAKTNEGTHPIDQYAHDILSAFYFTRTLDFSNMKPGQKTELKNFYKDTIYALEVKFKGRQKVDVKAGTFNTIIIEPIIQGGGLFKAEGTLLIWLTDDEKKIPVMVKSRVIVGSITAELTKYSGIPGGINAKVK